VKWGFGFEMINRAKVYIIQMKNCKLDKVVTFLIVPVEFLQNPFDSYENSTNLHKILFQYWRTNNLITKFIFLLLSLY
jgi:hypothetical protein